MTPSTRDAILAIPIRRWWWRFFWYPRVLRGRYVSVDRFRDEQRACLAACMRYNALREWVEEKRHHETDRPNFDRISLDAWRYAESVYP